MDKYLGFSISLRHKLNEFGGKVLALDFLMVALALSTVSALAQSPPDRGNGAGTSDRAQADVAKNTSGDQTPLTDRERFLLERIRSLEERLAAVESKVSKTTQPSVAPVGTVQPTESGSASSTDANAPGNAVDNSSSSVAFSSPSSGNQQDQQGSAQPKQDGGYQEPLIWGEWNPGPGFKVAKTKYGELNISGYMAARYLNQLPGDQTAFDHLGRVFPVQARQDFQLHRIMLYTSGWLLDPKFKYFTFVWSVNDTAQVAVGGALTYEFNKRFALGIGINPLPVNRTVQGNHPFWPSYDRMMADEFFRPFFTQGVFGGGELLHRLYYKWMTGNNLSTLNVRATQLTRELNFGGSLTWMPTTGEFGPRGALGDFEDHEKLATRFGIGYGVSRENRQSNENDPANNTTIRLADALNIFDTGALANGVTVQKVTWNLLAADVGLKQHGFWIGAEGYYRLLNDLSATGPLPVGTIRDTGFYVEATDMVVPKLVELYAGTSYVFSNFGKPKEFLFGGNYYPAKNRQYRLNVQLINVDHSPVNSTFGFYMGQLKGQILSVGVTALY